MKTTEIAVNLRGIDASGLAVKGQNVYDKLNGNANFTGVATYLPTLLTNIGNLTASITSGGKEPNKSQTKAIEGARRELRRILKLIGAIVNWEGNGDAVKLLTSGFDLKARPILSSKSFNVKPGKLSGEVVLEINSYGVAAYAWEMCPDPIGNWLAADLTTISKTNIKGLSPGVKYWFRVKITKGKTVVLVSDPHAMMVV